MKQQKGISTTLSILLIALLAVIVGGTLVYKYYLVPEEKPSAGEVPGEPQDETADWKTYRSEKYGFEVKYPPDWKVVDGGVHYFGFDKRDFDVCFGLGCMAPGIVIELHSNDNIETFWLWEVIQEGELPPTIKVIKKEVVTIRNREITKALLEQANGWQEWYYLFDSPEIKGFTLFSANTAKRDQIVYDLIAEKMLSTFRFIEKKESYKEPYIKVLSPNGGENLKVGDTYNIKWESNGIEKLMIHLTNYSCCSETPTHIVEKIPASQESYSWKIPDYGWGSEDNLKIFMVGDSDSRIQDTSDNYFHIYFNLPSIPETANWKTYTNEKYGFEIKYPDGTKIMDPITGDLNPINSANISMFPPSSLKGILKELVIDIDSPYYSSCPKKAPFVINGVNFNRTDVSGNYVGMETGSIAMEYCTMKDNVLFRLITLLLFSKYEHPPFDETKELEIVNQMLSTFRFLE